MDKAEIPALSGRRVFFHQEAKLPDFFCLFRSAQNGRARRTDQHPGLQLRNIQASHPNSQRFIAVAFCRKLVVHNTLVTQNNIPFIQIIQAPADRVLSDPFEQNKYLGKVMPVKHLTMSLRPVCHCDMDHPRLCVSAAGKVAFLKCQKRISDYFLHYYYLP